MKLLSLFQKRNRRRHTKEDIDLGLRIVDHIRSKVAFMPPQLQECDVHVQVTLVPRPRLEALNVTIQLSRPADQAEGKDSTAHHSV